MGTLVALYKPFDLSLQNLIKYKYLLYISFLFWFRLCPCTQGKKKGNEKVGREKRKKDQMYQLRYLLSSQLMFFVVVVFFVSGFVSFLFCSFSFFCHFLLVFNLLFVKINKKTLGCLKKKKKKELLFSKSIGERPTTTCSFPMVIDEHKIKCNCDNKTSNFVQLLL